MTTYAPVQWTVNDVFGEFKDHLEDWTGRQVPEKEVEQWLVRREHRIQSRLIELGWQVLEELLHEDYGRENERTGS